MLLYLRIEKEGTKKGRPYPVFKSRLQKIKVCELNKQQAVDSKGLKFEVYILSIAGYSTIKGSKKHGFMSSDYSKFEKFYQLITLSPACEGYDKVRNIRS